MSAATEILDRPLTAHELAARFRELCDDPAMANVPGKIELDVWGRILMTRASNYHGHLQSQLVRRLEVLPGRAMVETSVVTRMGVLVADVAWCSDTFLRDHPFAAPYARAPEICVEVVSPSNSMAEMQDKTSGYLAVDAVEVWLIYAQSRRIEFIGKLGHRNTSAYAVDLAGLFG